MCDELIVSVFYEEKELVKKIARLVIVSKDVGFLKADTVLMLH